MKYLKRFNKTSDYETFKNGEDYITPNITYISEIKGFRFNPKTKPVTPPSEPTLAMAGDVAYWDGSKVKTTPLSGWNTSLGTPVGVVVVPEGFAPDGKVRIIGLKPVDSNGNQSSSHVKISWGPYGTDTKLINFTRVIITDNAGSTSSGSAGYGFLPSDNFTGVTSFVDPKAKYNGSTPYVVSPYLGDAPNPEYYKELDGGNVLSDFNGLINTRALIFLGSDYIAANAAYDYNDGASNLQWYLPAMGELGYLMPRFNEINKTIIALGGVTVASYTFWSSSESSSYNAYRLDTASSQIYSYDKDGNTYIRPFAILGDSWGGKIVNHGIITPSQFGFKLTFEYPVVASRLEVSCGDAMFGFLAGSTSTSWARAPLTSLGSTVSFYPSNEDEIYIYEVTIE